MHPFASDFGLKFARQVHFRTETPYISSISDFAMGMQTSSITRPVSSAGDIRLYGKVSAARFPDSTGPPADILHRSYPPKTAISSFIALFSAPGHRLPFFKRFYRIPHPKENVKGFCVFFVKFSRRRFVPSRETAQICACFFWAVYRFSKNRLT